MDEPKVISGIKTIAPNYKGLLCDIWGVIHNGKEAFPEAIEALIAFKNQFGPVVLISNSPRPRNELINQLRNLGIPDHAYTNIVSSGDVTRDILAEFAPSGPCWRIGDPREDGLYAGLDIDLSGTYQNAAFISCTSPYNDTIETPEDYRLRFIKAIESAMIMICANPDLYVHRGSQLITCAGALAELYAELGGEVIMAGKPYRPIYDQAINYLNLSQDDKPFILTIGDGLPTDIKGAQLQGLNSLLIASGLHRDYLLKDGKLQTKTLFTQLENEGLRLDYVMNDLCWTS
jgi:HAD superfamily hydrolase (TIGR01459 family)